MRCHLESVEPALAELDAVSKQLSKTLERRCVAWLQMHNLSQPAVPCMACAQSGLSHMNFDHFEPACSCTNGRVLPASKQASSQKAYDCIRGALHGSSLKY